VLTRPVALSEAALAQILERQWDLSVASLAYLPLGAGSHHWEVVDGNGRRWFVTVDELDAKRQEPDESLDAAFERLLAALTTARQIRDAGLAFVVAPRPAADGRPVVRDGVFAAAVYPFVEGVSFAWGPFTTPAHRQGVLEAVCALHQAPASARSSALEDDFTIPFRGELRRAGEGTDGWDRGPLGAGARELLAANRGRLDRAFDRYDRLVVDAQSSAGPQVVTHGEPHPGNSMLGPDGWMLVDWDTVLLAPPERDLWLLDPGDGSALAAYEERTGRCPDVTLVELYRLRWDLADIAVSVHDLRRDHTGTEDDQRSLQRLDVLLAGLA
jgi:aminoglycoside phosphotransferase (APT) family kinase protein